MTTLLTKDGYKATKHADGTLVVHDVPIFCDCDRDEMKFSRNWIRKAVKKAKMKREEDSYLIPLHFRHHEPQTAMTNTVEAVGVVDITREGPFRLDGKDRLGVFADLIVTNEWAQDQLLRMRYPYRSVEIFDPSGEPSIDGLALLDHEAPFLTMPLLRVGEVRQADTETGANALMELHHERPQGVASATFGRGWSMHAGQADEPVLACFRRGDATHLLFKAPENVNPEDGKNEVEENSGSKQANMADSPEKKPAKPPAEDETEEQPPVEMSGEVEQPDETDEEVSTEGLSEAAQTVLKMIETEQITLADMKALVMTIEKAKSGTDEVDTEAGSTPAPAATPKAPQESMKASSGDAAKFAAMQGRLDALELRETQREEAEARRVAVDDAMKRLGDRPLPANFRQKLEKAHAADPEVFKDYVDSFIETFEANGETVEDATIANFRSQNVVTAKTPKCVSFYQEQGVEAVGKAASFAAQYEELHASGYARMTLERYVNLNMQKKGYQVPEEKQTA